MVQHIITENTIDERIIKVLQVRHSPGCSDRGGEGRTYRERDDRGKHEAAGGSVVDRAVMDWHKAMSQLEDNPITYTHGQTRMRSSDFSKRVVWFPLRHQPDFTKIHLQEARA